MARMEQSNSHSKPHIIIGGFFAARKMSHLQQKWIIDAAIIELVNEILKLDDNNKLTKIEVNRAVAQYFKNKADLLLLHNSNSYGVYKHQNEKRVNGKRERVTYYYFTRETNEIPVPPNSNTTFYCTLKSLARTTNTTNYCTQESLGRTIVTRHVSRLVSTEVNDSFLSRPSKRKRIEEEVEPLVESDAERINPVMGQTFWDSPEAKRWFGSRDQDESVEETMLNTIEKMKNAYLKFDGWRSIVSDNDQERCCTLITILYLCLTIHVVMIKSDLMA